LRVAEVADRFAGTVDDAVGHTPGNPLGGIVLHTKRPAGKIFLIEQRHGHLAGARQCVGQIAVLRESNSCRQKKKSRDEFHAGENYPALLASQARGESSFCTALKNQSG